GGVPLGLFGPSPKTTPGCGDFTGATACSGKITTAAGSDFRWTVPAEGDYTVVLKQPKVKYPIDGTLTIFDQAGRQVAYSDGGTPGANATVTQHFTAGRYKINVRDFARSTITGGYSFSLDVAPATEPAPPAKG